jgi:DNA-directed RNA polymerase specialized sigma24 family protein
MKLVPSKKPPSRSRSAVPRGVARVVLLEAGHRCAVCGVPCPLERAHIVPWSRRPSHLQEDLISLCANCHERADLEQWGEKTLRAYKQKPWVNRQNEAPVSIGRPRRIELVIDMEMADFDEYQQNMLRHALAGFLKVSPLSVRIRSKKPGSVRLTLDLPDAAAHQLLKRFRSDPTALRRAAPLLRIVDVREAPPARQAALASSRRGVAAVGSGGGAQPDATEDLDSLLHWWRPRASRVLRRFRIPPRESDEILRKTIVLLLPNFHTVRDPEAWFLWTLINRCLRDRHQGRVPYPRKRRLELAHAIDAALVDLIVAHPVGTESGDLRPELNSLLDQLPPRCRKLLRARYRLGTTGERAPTGVTSPPPWYMAVGGCIAALEKLMLRASAPDSEPQS